MTRLTPTELVAWLVFNENMVVGWYSATSQRPGPAMPATGFSVPNAEIRSGVWAD